MAECGTMTWIVIKGARMGGARIFASRAGRIGWRALTAIACTWKRVALYFSTTTSSQFVTQIVNRKSTCDFSERSPRVETIARDVTAQMDFPSD